MDQPISRVFETEQIADRRKPHLNSRARISGGSGIRFFIVSGKIFLDGSMRYDASEQSSGSERRDDFSMTAGNRIVFSSDRTAIQLRQAIAAHIAVHGWSAADIGPTTPESTHYPKHGEAAARLVASGDAGLASFCAVPARAS
jgi:hypothetical protein